MKNIDFPSGKNALVIFGMNDKIDNSALARQIASEHGAFKTYFSPWFDEDSVFLFTACDENTKTIIVEACPESDWFYEKFYNYITNGIVVNKQGANPYKIFPKFIFVSRYETSDLGLSFSRRFGLINTEQLDSSLVQFENQVEHHQSA